MTKAHPALFSEPHLPTATRELAVDILRGVSLIGVGGVNLIVFNAEAGHMEQYARSFPDALNQYFIQFFIVFLWGKYFPVFAFLFGLSAALALESKGVTPFLKRAMVLGGLGILQLLLVWKGDVLHQYAFMSLMLLPMRHLSVSGRLAIALGLYLMSFAGAFVLPSPTEVLGTFEEPTLTVFQSGNYNEIFTRRMVLFVKEAFTWEALFYQVRIFAWLLLGYLLGERKRFRKFVQPSFVYVLFFVSAFTLVLVAMVTHVTGLRGEEARSWGAMLGKAFLGAMFYASDVLILLLLPLALHVIGIGKMILAAFAKFGKMTLTHYLSQNLLYSFIFYGYGFGLYGAVAPVTLLLGYLALVTVQVLLSIWWLKKFENGPFELLVRTFTLSRK